MKFVLFFFVGLMVWSKSANAEINLTSESVVDGKIGKIHACRQKGGKDKSIQISALNLPADTKSISIILDDPDAIKPAGKYEFIGMSLTYQLPLANLRWTLEANLQEL